MAYNNPNILSGVSLNFKDRTLVLQSVVIVASLVMLVAILLFALLVPKPSTQGVGKAANEVNDVKRQIATLKTQEAQAGQTVAARAWIGSQNDVSASVLASLTTLARKDGLLIGSFRPQRATDLAGVTELPYAVQVNGPFPGVRQMMRTLDTPASKVVLRSAQITAATNSTTDVSATLGLSAYLATDPIVLAAAADAHQKKAAVKLGAKPKPKAAAGTARPTGTPLNVTITSKPVTRTGANTHGRS